MPDAPFQKCTYESLNRNSAQTSHTHTVAVLSGIVFAYEVITAFRMKSYVSVANLNKVFLSKIDFLHKM